MEKQYFTWKIIILIISAYSTPRKIIGRSQASFGCQYTKTQAILLALTEMIQRRKSRKVLELKGSLRKPYDYKTLRRKR